MTAQSLILIDLGYDLTRFYGFEHRWNCFEVISWFCSGICSLKTGVCAYSVQRRVKDVKCVLVTEKYCYWVQPMGLFCSDGKCNDQNIKDWTLVSKQNLVWFYIAFDLCVVFDYILFVVHVWNILRETNMMLWWQCMLPPVQWLFQTEDFMCFSTAFQVFWKDFVLLGVLNKRWTQKLPVFCWNSDTLLSLWYNTVISQW